MSGVSRWSYTNVATVWPFISKDTLNGGSKYGEPYLVACCWEAEVVQMIDDGGKEFISKFTYYHEDIRVKYLDRIARHDVTSQDWRSGKGEEIRSHLEWDMSMMEDRNAPGCLPDFKSVT